MRIITPFVWRIALIASIAVWALLSVGFWLKGSGGSPLDCLILGAMVLAIILPTGVERLVRKKWFPLAMSMWLLVIIPTALFAFSGSAGLCGKCAYLYIPLGVFGCLGYLGMRTLGASLRARRHRIRGDSVSTQLTSDSADARKDRRQSAAPCEPFLGAEQVSG